MEIGEARHENGKRKLEADLRAEAERNKSAKLQEAHDRAAASEKELLDRHRHRHRHRQQVSMTYPPRLDQA